MARSNAEKPLDRRQRRSRAALRQGLLELICEGPYDAITIDQIVDRADVGRATFYAHYGDKADLLRELSDELISEVAARALGHHLGRAPQAHSGASTSEIVSYAAEHPDLFRLVVSGAGGVVPRDRLFDAVRGVAFEVFADWTRSARKSPPLPVEVVAATYTGALLGAIEAWLAGHVGGSADELSVNVARTQVEGVRWALGLPASALAFDAATTRRGRKIS